uniref:Uncharacterized protein n=1 Tax=Glossina pallidipes TaxID=7398 RepID=A0A1A9ZAQ8_GLOPL
MYSPPDSTISPKCIRLKLAPTDTPLHNFVGVVAFTAPIVIYTNEESLWVHRFYTTFRPRAFFPDLAVVMFHFTALAYSYPILTISNTKGSSDWRCSLNTSGIAAFKLLQMTPQDN